MMANSWTSSTVLNSCGHGTRNGFSRRYRSRDRKSTRLNSSHSQISYAVFCLEHTSELQSQSNLVRRLLFEAHVATLVTAKASIPTSGRSKYGATRGTLIPPARISPSGPSHLH